MNRESFVFYKSFTESIGEIENAETRGKAYETIAFYALFGQEPTKDCEESVRVIFRQAKALLDKSQARYEKCKENGKKGGRPKKNKNQEITKTKSKDNQTITKDKPKTNQEETKTKANHNLNVDVDDDVNEDVNVNEEREKQVKEFFYSLSQKYPKIEINIKTINANYNLDKILNAIKQSKYLQNAPLSFILSNYEKVITSYYKSFDYDKNKPFISRDYDPEDDIFKFTDINDIKI